MTGFSQQYALWDEFLSVWPTSRLTTMSLDEYIRSGNEETFTYWLEHKLNGIGMGSIAGGSAFKFGVFSRKNNELREDAAGRRYSDTHGWNGSLGDTAEEAFKKVRDHIKEIASWAASGNLDNIETFDGLGPATKWKIAFHYQNRAAPTILGVLTKPPLRAYLQSADIPVSADASMVQLQAQVLKQRGDNQGIVEFGQQVWEAWSCKNLRIWKLSHGPTEFSAEEHQRYLQTNLGVMHGDTGKGQGKNFQDAQVGDLFYLCHGNDSLRLVGQFVSEADSCDKGNGWLQRRYRVLKHCIKQGGYQGPQKSWTPNYRSTFTEVRPDDLPEFESTLLKPFFDTDLAEVATLADVPIESDGLGDGATSPTSTTTVAGSKKNTTTCFNRIYYGPPGTGKTYEVSQLLKRYERGATCFVTFHQSYGYEEFVEGLRPVLNDSAESGVVKYEIRPGAFKKLCDKARQAPDQRFAMVIDEINRGNVSKIFGELITLLEPDKREHAENALSVMLPYSLEPFSVPLNVDIIGTMNTTDRSLALLDTALRRRFDFFPVLPDARDEAGAPLSGLRVTSGGQEIDIPRMLSTINQRIEVLYGRDHCIGHAYFTPLLDKTDGVERFDTLADIFRNRIVPLLEEYFFEDWHKIRLVLGDNQKPQTAHQFITESDAQVQDLGNLFGSDHGLDSYAIKRRYQPQPSAFDKSAAYLGIYQPLA